MPSRVRPTISSTETPGLRNIVLADLLTRAQCRSRSGATPSNTLAPSKTDDPSQIACVRAPHNGTLPSCQPPSKYVQVVDQLCPGAIQLSRHAIVTRYGFSLFGYVHYKHKNQARRIPCRPFSSLTPTERCSMSTPRSRVFAGTPGPTPTAC